MSKRNYRIALIPGDGIGHEVVPAAAAVLEKVAANMASALNGPSLTGAANAIPSWAR